jgi:hypothetical protein
MPGGSPFPRSRLKDTARVGKRTKDPLFGGPFQLLKSEANGCVRLLCQLQQ